MPMMIEIKEIRVENILKAKLYEKGIIEIIWDESIETVGVSHLKKMQEVVCELGGGKKMPLLFTAHEFLNISIEGGKYAASEEGLKFSYAIAFIMDSLAKKILFNFYVNFNKPKAPTRGFSTKEEAIHWLTEMKKEVKQES